VHIGKEEKTTHGGGGKRDIWTLEGKKYRGGKKKTGGDYIREKQSQLI